MTRRILVVDDNRDVLEAVSLLLESAGYDVLRATNGKEALSVLRTSAGPCLVLLDMMMPVMDGWQFLAELRRDPSLADISVIVISGSALGAGEMASMGAAGYLKKPTDIDELLSIVQQYA